MKKLNNYGIMYEEIEVGTKRSSINYVKDPNFQLAYEPLSNRDILATISLIVAVILTIIAIGLVLQGIWSYEVMR